jgi:two-component sensor histidine kinase
VVQAIARQTGRSARDIDDFTAQFGERLAGLGRSQDLLVQKNWQGVSLSDLVSAQLKPFVEADNNRVDANGPPVLLDADAAQNIGMALHELATNASKHGALSVPTGRVDIAWGWLPSEIGERGRRLQLQWSESGGPPVTPPKRKGFGHSVIERLTASSLHGTAKLDWRPEGLLWTLEVPEGSITKSEQNEVEASSPTQFETANSVPEH